MAEHNRRNAPEVPLSPGTQHKLALLVAGTIAAIAILLAILIALRTPQYEAQARLAYAPNDVPSYTPSTPAQAGAATRLAGTLLTDSALANLIDRFDLYAAQRQKQSTVALVGYMRTQLAMSEPEAGVLQLTFRDADQSKASSVTNGIAAVLAGYQTMIEVPAPLPIGAPDSAGKARHQSRQVRMDAHHARVTQPAAVVAAVPAPPRVIAPSNANTAELAHQIDRVDGTLRDLQDARSELESEQHQVSVKIEAVEKAERRSADTHRTEAARSERSVAEQDLAVEKAKLAALRERYTDAYPDVQSTQDNIANLQARIARLPAASNDKLTPEQAEAMERLRQERQRVERDLAQNQATVESETQRRMGLVAQLQQVKQRRPDAQAGSATGPVPVSAPPVVNAPPVAPSPVTAGPTISVPVLPFRVSERAGSAALVTTSRLALALWLGLGTAVLLALCFVPMVPAHYAAVVSTPEDLKKEMPEHVAYLGDVGRTEP